MAGIFQKFFREQIRQAGDGRVSLDAAPVFAAAAGKWFAGEAEQMQRRDHVRGLQGAERLAGERQAVLPHERAAETGAGHEHQDGQRVIVTRNPRFRHAAAMAVIVHGQWQRTTGLPGERRAVIRLNIPARETRRQVG